MASLESFKGLSHPSTRIQAGDGLKIIIFSEIGPRWPPPPPQIFFNPSLKFLKDILGYPVDICTLSHVKTTNSLLTPSYNKNKNEHKNKPCKNLTAGRVIQNK